MHYSVVIPSYNEAANLPRCLAAIATAIAGREDVELLLVDNHSSDDTVALARAAGVRVTQPPERVTIARLRNLGGESARGEVLLFLDADMEPPPDWLTTVDSYFAEDRTDVLGFVERIPEEAPWFARIWSERLRARRPRPVEVDFLPGRNICVRRELFLRVGGFDARLITSEDKDLVMRLCAAGAKVMSDPSLGIYHWGYERTLRELVRKEFWRQGSHLAMLRRHGVSLRLLRFPLLSLGHILAPAGALAALATGSPGLAAGLALLWFAPSMLQAASYRLSRRNPWLWLQFASLYWLRFTVAGSAVVSELFGHRLRA